MATLMGLISSGLYRPTALPFVDLSVVSPDGGTWLRRAAPGSPFERWLVVSRTGKAITEVYLPSGERLVAAGIDLFWSALKDKTHTVLRARVLEPGDMCRP